jgi:nitrogen regulatory protein PII
MKIITVIADQIAPATLSTALRADGVGSVTIDETHSFSRSAISVESYRGRRIAKHISATYRIEIVAEDAVVGRIVEGIAFVRGAGLLGEARARISAEAGDLFAAATPALATSA